jgi:hypothetical protein
MGKEATDTDNEARRPLHISDPIPLARITTTALPRHSFEYAGAGMEDGRNGQVNTSVSLFTNSRRQKAMYAVPPAPAPMLDYHSRRNTNNSHLRPIVTVDRASRSPRDLDDDDASTVVGGKEEVSFVDSGSEDESYNGEKRGSFQLVSNAEAGILLGGHWESR